MRHQSLILWTLSFIAALSLVHAASASPFEAFLEVHCYDCHADGVSKGGLDLIELGRDLDDEAIYARWEQVFNRVESGEMPPPKKPRPSDKEKDAFLTALTGGLSNAHAKHKGTVLRRLNRNEFENTMNDLFGTHLDLAGMLPEDGRSHEFDNVGASLGVSMTHLEQYLAAARLVYDEVASRSATPSPPEEVTGSYRERDIENHVPKHWKKLNDGPVVRFSSGSFPSGQLDLRTRLSGRYRVKVTAYAYQSEAPIVCSIGGVGRGSAPDKPIYDFVAFPPGAPTTIEIVTTIPEGFSLAIEPVGLSLPAPRPDSVENYDGPGLALVSATLEGPLPEADPSKGHDLLFSGIEHSGDDEKFHPNPSNRIPQVRKALLHIAVGAWRRPLADSEISRYVDLFTEEQTGGASFAEAYRTAATALFVSPHFLYLRESAGRLDDYALANRLSYFLNRTAPDDDLRAAAAQGQFAGNPGVIREHAERLMESEKFDRFLVDFTDAWLNLREMDFTAPDDRLFPEFDSYLRHSMPLETREFLRELIVSNLPARNIAKSEFAMLNSRLAQHYNLPSVNGTDVRKVSLPEDSLRGGFLSQASVLKVSANGTNTSPVMRGVWVLERIMGDPPSPPPPGIPGVEPDIRGASTLRELLDKHRDTQSCQACHQKIDPPGFALEVFNPIGGYRENFRSLGEGERVDVKVRGRQVRYRIGQPVDASGQLPSGASFKDFREFRDLLATSEETIAHSFTEKLLTFSTGREMGFSDRDEIEAMVNAAAARDYPVRELILRVISSDIFATK